MEYAKWKAKGNEIICAGSGARIAQVNVGWPDEEIVTHAYLIAAAPEMYEALRTLLALFQPPNNSYRSNAVVSRIKAILAKAEGRA